MWIASVSLVAQKYFKTASTFGLRRFAGPLQVFAGGSSALDDFVLDTLYMFLCGLPISNTSSREVLCCMMI